jgi:hypothetical protein
MRNRVIPAASVVAAALTGLTCSFPDDASDEVYVTIEAPAQVLLDGDRMSVQAKAWRLVGGVPDTGNVDDVQLSNVEFLWYTGSVSTARIKQFSAGAAEITGVNPGVVDITARVVSFENAADAIMPLRVSGFLEIDSITPSFVKWGEKVTLWGVGVQFAAFPTIGGGVLIPDTLSYVNSGGLSHMDYWVPQPARTAELFVIGPGVFFPVADTTAVDTLDLYEPNTTTPSLVNLDAGGPFPTIPVVRFFNPALAFEELPRDTIRSYDWYRFSRADTTQPLTIVLAPQGITDSTGLFIVLSDSIVYGGFGHGPGGNPEWFVTTAGASKCPKGSFFPFVQPTDSMIFAFRRMHRYVPGNDGLNLLAFYGQRQNYTVAIVQAYLTAHPLIGPDRFESNGLCTFADDNFNNPALTIDLNATLLGSLFQDSSLTIDNPHDLDLIRFRVTAAAAETVMVQVRSKPLGLIDQSDIDLYVMSANAGMSGMGSVSSAGSQDSMRVVLAPGDYYVAVVDFAGVPTKYSLCIRVRFGCTPITSGAAGTMSLRAPGGTRDRWRSGPGESVAGGRRWAYPPGAIPAGENPFRPRNTP